MPKVICRQSDCDHRANDEFGQPICGKVKDGEDIELVMLMCHSYKRPTLRR